MKIGKEGNKSLENDLEEIIPAEFTIPPKFLGQFFLASQPCCPRAQHCRIPHTAFLSLRLHLGNGSWSGGASRMLQKLAESNQELILDHSLRLLCLPLPLPLQALLPNFFLLCPPLLGLFFLLLPLLLLLLGMFPRLPLSPDHLHLLLQQPCFG